MTLTSQSLGFWCLQLFGTSEGISGDLLFDAEVEGSPRVPATAPHHLVSRCQMRQAFQLKYYFK